MISDYLKASSILGTLASARNGRLILTALVVVNLVGTQRVQWMNTTKTRVNYIKPSKYTQSTLDDQGGVINLEALACPDTSDSTLHGNYSLPVHKWKLPGNPEGTSLPRLEFFSTAPSEPVADYSYSRFAQAFYLDSKRAIHLVVMSDRAGNPPSVKFDPLPALVNSLLLHSSMPIVMHLVTRYPIPWLDELDSPWFQVNYYNYERLGFFGHAFRLQRQYNFQSSHKSMPMPMVKLFFSLLPLPPPPPGAPRGIANILLVDDDITFFNDPATLWRLLDPKRLALNCPIDGRRIYKFYTSVNQTSNGHSQRYCNSGMVNLPILPKRAHPKFGWTNDLMELYFNATASMTQEYPEANFLTADQDIYNRLLADREDLVDFIPCQWHCDYNSCKRGQDGQCENCRVVGRSNLPSKRYCQTFHYVSGTYKFRKSVLAAQVAQVAPPDAGIVDYTTLWGLPPLQTMLDHFVPNVTSYMRMCKRHAIPATRNSTT